MLKASFHGSIFGWRGLARRNRWLRLDGVVEAIPPCDSHAVALDHVVEALNRNPTEVVAVGHRVVHGGARFIAPAWVDDELTAAVESLIPLAPLHNDACLSGLRAARDLYPDLPHVAAFDTAFHATLPEAARTYALPSTIGSELGIRRYGFHGISHEFVAKEAARYLQTDLRTLKVVTCHLGNGCSMAAVKHGESIETSMGMTPLEGLVMGTRCGDVDPGVLLHLLRERKLSLAQLDDVLNRHSGLLGLCGVSSMQEVEAKLQAGDRKAQLAMDVFSHRVRQYIGAYAATMGGIDLLVFTGGIGEHSALTRERCVAGLEFLGIRIDADCNAEAQVGANDRVCDLSRDNARVRTFVIATDEEQSIAQSTAQIVRASRPASDDALTVPVAISARHVHLREETIAALFGPDHPLTQAKPLSQPGHFAAAETVTLIGPEHRIENVRVLGPPRSADQVEISRTDEIHLGLDAPVRASGRPGAHTRDYPGRSPRSRAARPRGDLRLATHSHVTRRRRALASRGGRSGLGHLRR